MSKKGHKKSNSKSPKHHIEKIALATALIALLEKTISLIENLID